MTPKEKAQDLFFKVTMISLEQTFGLPKTSAKQCALIAVDEMIEELIVTDFANRFPYWQEVKQEIEKL